MELQAVKIEYADLLSRFEVFFSTVYYKHLLEAVQKKLSVVVNWEDFERYDHELADYFLEMPEECMKAIDESISNIDVGESTEGRRINVRFTKLPERLIIPIKNLRSKHIKKFIAVAGIIKQASEVRPEITAATFECKACGERMTLLQENQELSVPYMCECGNKRGFELVTRRLIDLQRLELEENPESLEGTSQARKLAIFVKDDLVDPKFQKKIIPGNKVHVTGIMYDMPMKMEKGRESKRRDIYLEGSYVETVDREFDDIIITKEDEEKIKDIAVRPEVYALLVKSIAPSIYGYESIKEAIALQLFGGVRKIRPDGMITRGDIHMLLIGDPGAGKSQLIKYVTGLAPKARYVVGKSASGAGLCIAPDSLIVTNPGGIHKIKDIVEENLKENEKPYCPGVWNSKNPQSDKKIFTLDADLKVKPKEINQLWRIAPPEHMIKFRTRLGKEVMVTPNTSLYVSGLKWKEASEIKEGEYLATTRNLTFPESTEKILAASLLKSNPTVLGVKPKVKMIVETICKKKGWDKRTLCKELKLSELSIYHNWVNEKARGNIHLGALKQLCNVAGVALDEAIEEDTRYSLYNGHSITLPKYLNEDILYFAGLMAGDGDLSKGEATVTVRFSNASSELMTRFVSLSKQLFDVELNCSSKASEKRPESWRFSSKLVFEILEALGLPQSPKSHRIDMSNTLLRVPNSMLAHYLRGYYDTDGGCVERKTKGAHYIASSSASKIFSEKLKLILLRYGIIARIREKEPRQNEKVKAKYPQFHVEISGKENLEKFREFICFEHPQKKEKLDRIIGKISRNGTNIDIIPEARELVREMERDLKTRLFVRKRRDGNGISKNYLLSMLPEIEKHKHKNVLTLKLLANSDILWDTIVSKEIVNDHGYEHVYDLTVDRSHNFIVNGVLVHNTATVVKDEFMKGWALEAGALVLANKGLCAIDELDKMGTEDRSAMHEVMEQQCYHPDTEIILADGKKVKIGSFVDALIAENKGDVYQGKDCEILPVDNIHIQTTDMKKIFTTPVARVSRHKAPNKLYKITYANGRSIIVTPEHPTFIHSKDKIIEMPADQVKVGMLAPTPLLYRIRSKENEFFNEQQASEVLSNGTRQMLTTQPQRLQEDNSRQQEFLRDTFIQNGFVEGDTFGYITSSYDSAKSIQDLLLNNAIWSSIEEEQKAECAQYKVSISKNNVPLSFSEEIGLIFIKNVEVVENHGLEWVYDVTIEPTKTFLSEGLVLHNTVTISKANIQATLSAKTTILAAANPKFGRFDAYTSIPEQIDLPDTLLSRFDLIFPIRDIPSKEKDTKLVRHILALHANPERQDPPLDSEFLRKYIAYAKGNCRPILTQEAQDEIERFYVTLRNKYSSEEVPAVPIGARQLEAIVRLSEASAKIRLSDKIEKSDAQRSIRILTECLMQVGIDPETGKFDIDRLESGTTTSQRNKIRIILKLVEDMQKETEDKLVPMEDLIAAAEEQGIQGVEQMVKKLKEEGELFEPRTGFLKKV